MGFKKVCNADDLWEGELLEVEIDKQLIILVRFPNDHIRAYQGICPHQDIPLIEGSFDGKVIMCKAHQWTFDASSGVGLNPVNCHLTEYPVLLEGDDILVSVEGVKPFFATT